MHCNNEIPMNNSYESFVTAGSSIWSLTKKIGSMLENVKKQIIEAVEANVRNIVKEAIKESLVEGVVSVDIEPVKAAIDECNRKLDAIIAALSNTSTTLEALENRVETVETEVKDVADKAGSGVNFEKVDDMKFALTDKEAAKKLSIGTMILLKDENTPDYWVTDVLDEPDPETGFYCKIEPVEAKTQNHALTNDDIDRAIGYTPK